MAVIKITHWTQRFNFSLSIGARCSQFAAPYYGLTLTPAPPPLAVRPPPDGYIRVPYDDVDPMPDYENVLTD